MKLLENVPLAQYTTFRIGGPARFFCIVNSGPGMIEAVALAKREKKRFLILGGGSNILISDAGFTGVVIKNEIMGKGIVPMGGGNFRVSVGAGENWDEVVQMAVDNGLYGIENLSAIPGTAGAAPVQNIGAYGAEIANVIMGVKVLDTRNLQYKTLTRTECKFGYRDSVFKQKKGRYIIVQVDLKLSKQGKLDTTYKDLKEHFERSKKTPTLQSVRDAVVDVRWKKLPDWKLWGTAGSFFKNPVVSKARYEKVKSMYPDLPGYPEGDRVKVPLGWILDHICKMRGEMANNVGSYENQALVIVTKPGATAAQVVARAKEIIDLVREKTGIRIEAEVEWVN